jgi:hypothetical protein
MSQIWRDRIQQTVTGTPGTGAFTLSTAVAGFQALGAGDDGNTGFFCATDGTAWETFYGTYTNSGTSLARTIRTDSSTGSAISFTSAAIVFLDLTANISARLNFETNLITGTDADTTCVSNVTYLTAMSGWATANRTYTMPASPAVGDRVCILIQSGNASFALIVKGNTSQTINGGSAATEWSRLFAVGERVVLLYVASNTWIVEHDGRIQMKAMMHLSTSATGESANVWTYPTSNSGVWTVESDVGNIGTAASDKFTARRACIAELAVRGYSNSAVSNGSPFAVQFELNGTVSPQITFAQVYPGANANVAMNVFRNYGMATGDYVRYQYRSGQGSIGLNGSADGLTSMSFVEMF